MLYIEVLTFLQYSLKATVDLNQFEEHLLVIQEPTCGDADLGEQNTSLGRGDIRVMKTVLQSHNWPLEKQATVRHDFEGNYTPYMMVVCDLNYKQQKDIEAM
jgi:hypothetical protein